MLRFLTLFLFLGACAPAPGETRRFGTDSSFEEDSQVIEEDAARLTPDATSKVPDASVACDCTMASAEETRQRSSTCGNYEEKRACNGCTWGAWQGTPPACACEPGSTGETREVEGGTGCAAGKRMEQEVCNDDGSGYTWTATTSFDGSAKECEANSKDTRTQQGSCREYQQTRTCSSSCKWGSWTGSEGECYPDNKYIGDACGNGGTCQCSKASPDSCSPAYTCPDGFQWRTGLCGGRDPVCCEPMCGAMDAVGTGDTACPLGHKFNGSDCVLVRGCSGCTGADCDRLLTFTECSNLKTACS